MIPPTALQLSAAHRPALLKHFLALDKEDRRLRFGHAVAEQGLQEYVNGIHIELDGVFGVFDDNLDLVGVAHVALQNDAAEFGVSVLPQARRRGIGKLLFQRASDYARNKVVRTLFMHCLAENSVMVHIARNAGMEVVIDSGEADAHLKLPPADPLSITGEMLHQRVALFDFALKSQSASAKKIAGAVMDAADKLRDTKD